jgi:hypothetical protein
MRLEARVLEGDETVTALVPLRTLLAFKQEHGKGVNHFIAEAINPDAEADFSDWEPWLAWRTMTDRHLEERTFDTWLEQIEWVGIYQAPNELDPSGGEATPTQASSPESSSASGARGASSSSSTRTSKRPSGTRSKA